MNKNSFGVFEITLPAKDGQAAIPHNSKIKVCLLPLYPLHPS
jgi:1,4-alpha-glucan branching enzyme